MVIDAGITDQLDKLRPLQDRLAGVTRVVTYNRAGYGQSEPGPLPRDSGREADELKALLERASVPGPYVLVGHSLGALNVKVFASRYPDLVAGMVLLDPPPLSFILGQEYKETRRDGREDDRGVAGDRRFRGEIGRSAGQGAGRLLPHDRVRASRDVRESAKLVGAIASFGDIPLVVIAAGKPNPALAR